MSHKLVLLAVLLLALSFTGCRTGEYKADLEVYEAMPGLVEGYPEVAANLEKNEDGSLHMEFEQGTVLVWLRTGADMDVVSRMKAASGVFEIFHGAYMQSELNKKKNGDLYRDKIFLKGYVEDTELYVMEWDLNEPDPVTTNNREGNFF